MESHWHVYPFSLSTQVPPFKQGPLAHSSTSVWHLVPSYPGAHWQRNEVASGKQVAPLTQGCVAHGESTTPPPSPLPWPFGCTGWIPVPLEPGRHPIGPTPVPWYPGLQKHCTAPEVDRQTAIGLQPPLLMWHGPRKMQVSPLPW